MQFTLYVVFSRKSISSEVLSNAERVVFIVLQAMILYNLPVYNGASLPWISQAEWVTTFDIFNKMLQLNI
jgi:hypothetical protein